MEAEVVERPRAAAATDEAGDAPAPPAPAAHAPDAPARRRLRVATLGWRGMVREAAVIAAGALAALGAQAWWQGRENRARERDYLRQLLVDTRENERRLGTAVARDSVTYGEIRRVVRALYTRGPAPSPDSVVAWLRGTAFSASDFRPVTGTYAALVSTGDLRLIRTDSLRSRLIAYAGQLEDARRDLNFYLQQGFGDAGRIARALPFLEPMWIGSLEDVRAAGVDVARLRRDPEVLGVFFTLQVANSNRLSNVRRLREETWRLRRALEAEPGVGPVGPSP